MAISGLGVAYSVGGFVLLLSGWSNVGVKDTLTSLLKGQAPTPKPTGAPTIGVTDAASSSSSAASSAAGSVAQGGAAGGSASANQAIAKMLAAPYGWSTGTEWNDLVSLWDRESGWSNTIWNEQGSGAYGIAQALPATKYPKAGQPPSDGGSSNATAQISWGLAYIKSTYGSPSAAWAHETSAGWY